MNCTKCGAQNPDHARFCNQCGNMVRSEQAPSFEGGGTVKRQRMLLLLSILVALVGAAMAFFFSLSAQRGTESPGATDEIKEEKGLFQGK